ncbi:MAG: hypothetical protein H6721_32730 [Sandaracinus sp.]|nr:hypothetical protein [Sandaracinus sp.]
MAKVFRGEREPPPDASALEGLVGRVLRVGPGQEATELTTNGKKLAWMLGPDGLFDALPHRSSGWDVVRDAQGKGSGRDVKLRGYIQAGSRWLLLVTPEIDVWAADWDGLLAALRLVEPEVASRVAPHVPRFRRRWLGQMFDENALRAANEAKNPGKDGHVSVARFLADEPTLERAALVLFHVFGVNEDYQGDGRGQGGNREFLATNRRLDQLKSHVLIDLRVEAP